MRLYEFRKSKNWTQTRLAEELGCSQPMVSAMERAKDPLIPGRDLMEQIHRVSNGAVTPGDFYQLPSLDRDEAA